MKLGVREICDVVFKAKSDITIGNTSFVKNEPVLYIDTAKTSSLDQKATTVYAQGGKGNARLIAWEGEKQLTFDIEDALISPVGLAVLSGAGIVHAGTTKVINVHTTSDVILSSAGTAIIDADVLGLGTADVAYVNFGVDIFGTVLDDAGAGIGSLGKGTLTSGTAETGINVAGTGAYVAGYEVDRNVTKAKTVVISFTDGVANAGKTVRVDYYLIKADGAQQITINASDFAGYYYLEASTLFRDEATGEDLPAEIVIPNVKIQSNFTLTMASTGDPSTFKFTMDAFPAYTKFDTAKKVLCAIQVVGEDAVVA